MGNLEGLFSIKTVKKEEDETKYIPKRPTIFDYLDDICFKKTGTLPDERDPEMKAWDTFMILRYLSMDENYLPVINIFNMYQSMLSKKQIYHILLLIIPKRKTFLSYPKLKETIQRDEDIAVLREYYQCSSRTVVEYLNLGFFSRKEIDDIRTKFGGKDKK